uniref:RNaseH n=1 Tax=Megaviridae environmental sample TaxID=1737588 RepID=A0A5J6VIQ2_9VIRU|nr:MAG: RNaseH [Megaviridae environmental sample]
MIIYTDGACKGNPGRAGIGIVFYDNGVEIYNSHDYIGITTNNIAEYTAIKKALEHALKLSHLDVIVYSDSMLAVQQLNGKWRVKNQDILAIYNQVIILIRRFDKIIIKHVKGHAGIKGNERADELANLALN